jgi:hypothetical protein
VFAFAGASLLAQRALVPTNSAGLYPELGLQKICGYLKYAVFSNSKTNKYETS